MSCAKYDRLIETWIEGTIDADGRRELEEHARECAACGEELAAARRVESLVRGGLAVEMSAEAAGRAVMGRLEEERGTRGEGRGTSGRPEEAGAPEGTGGMPMQQRLRWAGVAAMVVLAAGVGFGIGRSSGGWGKDWSAGTGGTEAVREDGPVRVKDLRGTALVQYIGRSSWEPLTAGTKVGLGARFLVTPNSEVSLALPDRSSIQIGPNTDCALLAAGGGRDLSEKGLEFNLVYGKADLSLTHGHRPFAVTTPQGRIDALGTVFTVVVK